MRKRTWPWKCRKFHGILLLFLSLNISCHICTEACYSGGISAFERIVNGTSPHSTRQFIQTADDTAFTVQHTGIHLVFTHITWSLLRPQERCKVLRWVCLSVCLFVCLSACITRKPHGQTSPNCCARCLWPWLGPSDGVAIRYGLPVLWMTSRIHTVALWCVMCIPKWQQNTTNITAEIPTIFCSTIRPASWVAHRGEVFSLQLFCYHLLSLYRPVCSSLQSC